MITFIIGGARSGKSRFALNLADNFVSSKEVARGEDKVFPTLKKAYIATAQALDEEMKERIQKHKKERSGYWATYEEPINISSLIKDIHKSHNVVLIDCLTLWLSNLMISNSNSNIEREIKHLIDILKNPELQTPNSELFIVSNEVGLGIVPDNALSRKFRDMAGYLNRKVAEIAAEVYFVTAGIPLKIK